MRADRDNNEFSSTEVELMTVKPMTSRKKMDICFGIQERGVGSGGHKQEVAG